MRGGEEKPMNGDRMVDRRVSSASPGKGEAEQETLGQVAHKRAATEACTERRSNNDTKIETEETRANHSANEDTVTRESIRTVVVAFYECTSCSINYGTIGKVAILWGKISRRRRLQFVRTTRNSYFEIS